MFEALEKAGINGLVCGAGTTAIFGTGATLRAPFTNSSVPLWLFSFRLASGSSLIGDAAHLAMKPDVSISEKWRNRSTLLVSAGVNAALFYAGMSMLTPGVARDIGMIRSLLLAGGGEVVGSALYSYGKENLYI